MKTFLKAVWGYADNTGEALEPSSPKIIAKKVKKKKKKNLGIIIFAGATPNQGAMVKR